MNSAAADNRPALVVDGGIATLRLRRPAQRNSLRDTDLHALLDAFQAVDADPGVRVLVVTAETAGQPRPVFSAGYDVSGFEGEQHDPRLFESVPDALERLRPLTLCALSGSVYGGATDIALACDLRIGVVGGEFRMPACALGLHYYPSGLRRYVSRLGVNGAKQAFLTAQPIAYETLLAWGVLESVVMPDAFDAAVAALATRLASLAPLAAQATKRSIDEIGRGQSDDARLREREALTLHSADFAEGRAAFAEKRPPRFSGR
jgi:enoyl-CoA hydratase/carnithine racemase